MLEHEASIAPLDLHLETLAVNRVRRMKNSKGDRAVEESCKATADRAQRRLRTEVKIPETAHSWAAWREEGWGQSR